ncbi:hypothetical protein KJS94_06110 [Flavihumibacter rivuli]|uniref:hypothetical protein n=1 Tax=Flavihumibacter rivuli TaxID=2838156 RepID=UPI001BDE3B40|nr:hypothetical protein [Flavihumibacter rivuli]ULQ57770.1 hypothetical protein KJS94_06110 [Flavihumibacter rivuli]
MNAILSFLLLTCFPFFSFAQLNLAPIPNTATPEEITLRFLDDYAKWNADAIRMTEKEDCHQFDMIEETYHQLVMHYCLPGRTYSGASYGSDPLHSPSFEKIKSTSLKSNTAVVTTMATNPKQPGNGDTYEYHYIRVDNRWWLEEIYLLDREGKYKHFNFQVKKSRSTEENQ